jgi:ribosomal protein S12 methylthiotransferase accessory factor
MAVSRLDLTRYLRKGAAVPAAEATLDWVVGRDLLQQRPSLVPADVIRLYDQPPSALSHPFWQTSDGFGAGSTLTEAILHGLCERVERDARTLAALQSSQTIIANEIAVETLGSPDLSAIAGKIARAGLSLRVFDITSNLKIPTYQAVIAPLGGKRLTFLDLASGTGTHPYAARAALRAVLEAAQTRLTAIAGARDDFDPALYGRPLPEDLEIYLAPAEATGPGLAQSVEYDRPGDPAAQLGFLLSRLRQAGITSVIAVSFETEVRYGVFLARVIVPQLEDDLGSANWRPGKRALPQMLRL